MTVLYTEKFYTHHSNDNSSCYGAFTWMSKPAEQVLKASVKLSSGALFQTPGAKAVASLPQTSAVAGQPSVLHACYISFYSLSSSTDDGGEAARLLLSQARRGYLRVAARGWQLRRRLNVNDRLSRSVRLQGINVVFLFSSSALLSID